MSFSLFRGCTGKPLHFMSRQRLSSAQPMALGQESFACISLEKESLPFITQLVPESMKLGIMRSMYNVTELM